MQEHVDLYHACFSGGAGKWNNVVVSLKVYCHVGPCRVNVYRGEVDNGVKEMMKGRKYGTLPGSLSHICNNGSHVGQEDWITPNVKASGLE